VPLGRELYETTQQKLDLEARNGKLQFAEILAIIDESWGQFYVTPKIIKRLHKAAIQDIYACAGEYRNWPVSLKNSCHVPPSHEYIHVLMEEMCARANTTVEWTPVETAAYLMWRLNWIHPFGGGNGRTARAVSYFALTTRLGFLLPGKVTVVEQLVSHRPRYQNALEDADAACRLSVLDFSKMTALLDELLTVQLAYLKDNAGGSQP
jgi:Fic family protein